MKQVPTITDGSLAFLIFDARRRWLRKIMANQDFHSDKGFLHFDDLIGQSFGQTFALSQKRRKIAVLQPIFSDIVHNMKRQSQIIYPEDIGLILIYSKIHPNFHVLEAGTGSGTVSGIMGIFSQPNGHVNTFDIREKALKQARKNITSLGAAEWCSADFGDICEDPLEFTNLDFIMLDLATPWLAIPKVLPHLAPTGRMCCFSPTIEQVKKNCRVLKQEGFKKIKTMELLRRTFQVKPNATRPRGRMVGHSGYLTFAALQSEEEDLWLSPNYRDYYTPENIGNLLSFGGIFPGQSILILTATGSPLPDLIRSILFDLDPAQPQPLDTVLETMELDVADADNTIEKQIQTHIDRLGADASQEGQFHVILIDNITSKTIQAQLDPLLFQGGVMCGLSESIDVMKNLNQQLWQANYYNVDSSELIN